MAETLGVWEDSKTMHPRAILRQLLDAFEQMNQINFIGQMPSNQESVTIDNRECTFR